MLVIHARPVPLSASQCLSVPLKTGQKWTMAFPFKKKLLCSADPNEDNGNPVPKRGRVLHDTYSVYTKL